MQSSPDDQIIIRDGKLSSLTWHDVGFNLTVKQMGRRWLPDGVTFFAGEPSHPDSVAHPTNAWFPFLESWEAGQWLGPHWVGTTEDQPLREFLSSARLRVIFRRNRIFGYEDPLIWELALS
jgi:hypothetical protein